MWQSERLCLRVACVIALPPFVLAAFADPPLYSACTISPSACPAPAMLESGQRNLALQERPVVI